MKLILSYINVGEGHVDIWTRGLCSMNICRQVELDKQGVALFIKFHFA